MTRTNGSNRETGAGDKKRWSQNPRRRPQVVKRKPGQGPGSQTFDPLLFMNEGFPRRAGVGMEDPRGFTLSR